MHELFYLNTIAGKRMYYLCPKTNRKVLVMRVEGLEIPERDSERLARRKASKRKPILRRDSNVGAFGH